MSCVYIPQPDLNGEGQESHTIPPRKLRNPACVERKAWRDVSGRMSPNNEETMFDRSLPAGGLHLVDSLEDSRSQRGRARKLRRMSNASRICSANHVVVTFT